MKKQDLFFIVGVLVFFSLFIFVTPFTNWFMTTTKNHGYLMAFLKFGILATLGELIATRIKTGAYMQPHYGLFPKAIVWGLFGVWIAAFMTIFKAGAPVLLESCGIHGVIAAMQSTDLTGYKLLGAFSISVLMNTSFAPVFMTCHKISDTHINTHQGSLKALVTPIPVTKIITNLNWDVQWNFVFKKTIPLFWFPAHTITFILPGEYQVLSAALLSIALGLILSIASLKSKK